MVKSTSAMVKVSAATMSVCTVVVRLFSATCPRYSWCHTIRRWRELRTADGKIQPIPCNLKPLRNEGREMLEGKVAMITGASQGLGRAIALAFAKEGAQVAINARSEESVRPVAEEVEET